MMKKLLCALVISVISIGIVNSQEEINVQGNGIDIAAGDTTPSSADGTDFGQVNTGASSTEQIFVIQNTGDAPLTITTQATTDPVFNISTLPSGSVAPGESTTIGITFNAPATAGVTTGQLFIFSSDSDENPYSFSITGEAVLDPNPEINVTGNSISIVGNGTNSPNTSDGTDFGSVSSGNSSDEQIFVIQNQGGQPLSLGSIFTTNPEFAITTTSPSSIPAGGSANIGITFNASTAGVRTATLFITNGDADENPYQINLRAISVLPPPEINVTGNGITIVGNGTNTPNASDGTDFGQLNTSTSSTEQLFVIQNTGTSPLAVSSFVTTNPAFAITTTPSSSINPGATTTIGITFSAPASPGVVNGILVISNDDPDENPYQINLTAEVVVVTSPEINITGNGVSIPSGTNTPSSAAGTNFGQVPVGSSSAEQLFVIENTGTAPLTVNPSFTTNPLFAITTPATSPVAPGSSTTIGITYNAAASASVTNAVLLITNNDSDESSYQINLTAETIDVAGPEINLLDNSNANLASGGTVNFGTQNVSSGSQTFTFTIQNTGTADLNLTNPSPFVTISGANASDFSLTALPSSPIAANGSTTFAITFDPSALGTRTASVSIANNDSDESPYTFIVTGEGIDANAGTPLLITQYYENGNNDYIEIKNVSSNFVPPQFFLCLYSSDLTESSISSSAPVHSIQIPSMTPGEVRVFKNPNATDASGSDISTNASNFDGNDVILISSTNDNTAYGSRIDIMGVVGTSNGTLWGQNVSYIKGCGTNESPSTTFGYSSGAPTDYIRLETTEVDTAPAGTNLRLGIQTVGATTWSSSWNNGIPDKTKTAIISGTYNASNGSFETCDLTINPGANVNFGGATTNFVKVNSNLTINGTFTIGDQAALVTLNNAPVTGSITKQESTTTLKQYDFTYWSSPVQGATTSVFTSSGAPADRIFEWRKPVSGNYGGWQSKSGGLESARGYISEGPDGATQHNVTFTGTPHNGEIGIGVGYDNTIAVSNGGGGFNLIGNPYPCAIDIREFISWSSNDEIRSNSATDGNIWLWTHNTAYQDNPGTNADYVVADYVTLNLAGSTPAGAATYNIGSAQGFFVKAVRSGSVFFQDIMKLDGENTQFFRGNNIKKSKKQDQDRMWLTLKSNKGGAFNQILVGFFEEATDGVDRGFDAVKFSAGNYISLYSKIGDNKYAIQGLGSYSSDKKVAIGFDSYIKEKFTISINKLEGVLESENIYLVDNYLNVVHDLKASDYEFEVTEKGSYADRFTLQFTKSVLSSGSEELENNFIVSNEDNTLRVKASNSITKLKVYDMLGRLLIDEKPNRSDYYLNTDNISNGSVLILNAVLENGAEVSKKAIKF